MQKLNEEFGVYAMKSYDEFVDVADGIIVTARHGDNHYKYAKPYIKKGIPMFIDKPITVSEEDAVDFMKELKANNIKVCGGSMCVFASLVQEYAKAVKEKTYGEVYGGYVRAPINMDNPYGGFFFYSQHLVQMMCEMFGYYPNSVTAIKHDNHYNCLFNYDNVDVKGTYINGNYRYYAGIDCADGSLLEPCEFGTAFVDEFMHFYTILTGGEMHQSYDDFFAPVFILNAIVRSYENGGKCEKILRAEDIK
jgi:predicted dehydrogenase